MIKFSSSIHCLSEEEMKSVIGGTGFQVDPKLIVDEKFRFCPACGHAFSAEELSPGLLVQTIVCPVCGSKHQVE